MKQQTLVIRHDTDTGKTQRMRIVAGDCVQEINRGPSCSFDGRNYYSTGRLITASMRRRKWYRNAQFDDQGNSDWLQ
jgi:hypothetical protein